MSKQIHGPDSPAPAELFDRIVSILEQARLNVVRAVNSNMVTAYWAIGREIVMEIQEGEERADYGLKVIPLLAEKLTSAYGQGFSETSLRYFRVFYLTYPEVKEEKQRTLCAVSDGTADCGSPAEQSPPQFAPELSWSHYRALMRVDNISARAFYEQEAVACSWNVRVLQRHIHTYYYERLLRSQNPQKSIQEDRDQSDPLDQPIDTLKSPYVLEFLNIPDPSGLHESQLESAIIKHLQEFMLELGKGFAFVARQRRLSFEDTDLYVDLVFYNCILKCYLLVDLKMGKLSHADVGQMDGYVRMFDDLCTADDDNPTIGLILCTEKNDAVARYSVVNDRKQIFASKYVTYLPTEAELSREIARERRLIEDRMESDQASDACIRESMVRYVA